MEDDCGASTGGSGTGSGHFGTNGSDRGTSSVYHESSDGHRGTSNDDASGAAHTPAVGLGIHGVSFSAESQLLTTKKCNVFSAVYQ